MTTEATHAAFEAHYSKRHDGFMPGMYDGEYDWLDAQPCWEAWQAATAEERERAALVCDPLADEWESERQVTELNYAGACAAAIRSGK